MIKKFTVDRSKWRCYGHGEGPILLLNSKGFSCCLGFVGEQLGVPDELLLGTGCPATLDGVEYGKFKGIPTAAAMLVNDCPDHSSEERESRLRELFSESGHELEFMGEY